MYFKEKDMDINRNNYETFLLLYLDGELNPSERTDVEKFLNDNADLQKEFALLRQTILIPSPVVFDQKELLFRKEEKRRVFPIYWTRIAAAVAVLLFSGWLITTQLINKQRNGIAGGVKNIDPSSKVRSDQKIQEAKNSTADITGHSDQKIQPAVQQNITVIKNKRSGNTGDKTKSVNDLSGKNDAGLPLVSSGQALWNPAPADDPETANLAMQKSSVQEIQTEDLHKTVDPKRITVLTGNQAPVVLFAAAGASETVKYENALLTENEYQTDNAISVVALNDKNKGITGFFKKLTKRPAADDGAKKLRVSVFQFSY
jgi:hypothetical protein